jgi:hypothetical protein
MHRVKIFSPQGRCVATKHASKLPPRAAVQHRGDYAHDHTVVRGHAPLQPQRRAGKDDLEPRWHGW